MAKKEIGYVELRWTCPNCSGMNPGRVRVCSNCGAPMPQNVKFEQSARQELITGEEIAAEAKAGPDIHCPYCGTRNPGGTQVCSQCGGDLSEAALREAGQVVGAFSVGAATMIKCPTCGAENPDTALNCAQCGSSLKVETPQPVSPVGPAASAPRKTSPLLWVGIAAAVLVICGGIFFFIYLSTRTDASTGIVSTARWERSIPIEALVPVEYSDWQDQIPPDAVVGSCSEDLRAVQDEPAPQAVEVCGTPYTIDTGSGLGQVVQDCEYEIYDTRCSYSVQEWRQVDVQTLSGTDLQPVWPEPLLEGEERLGSQREEKYYISFSSGGETYIYTTTDFNLFQQTRPGSEWTLNINSFGNLVSVEPFSP
jgi:DNA-directed RNA polymerase subunit RPC12/RpoP